MMEHREEPILVEQISGTEVIADLADRLVGALSHECYLRETDAYESYSAVLTAEVQVHGLDTERVATKLVIGDHNPAAPSHRVTVKADAATASEVRARSGQALPPSLERLVDGSEPAPVTTAEKRRYYTPRTRKPAA